MYEATAFEALGGEFSNLFGGEEAKHILVAVVGKRCRCWAELKSKQRMRLELNSPHTYVFYLSYLFISHARTYIYLMDHERYI